MYFAIIDCGTTNSRIYIVNEKREIVGKSTKKVGVGNVAVRGSNEILKEGLKETFLEAVQKASLKLDDISFAISSGVITSEIGLLEIPHLLAPVSIDELAQNVKKIKDVNIFPLDIPVVFVRGIKTTGNIESSNLVDVGKLDFMRGEETQVAGFLSKYNYDLPLTIIFLTSHTKYVSINRKEEIVGSITTLSGQLYEAVSKGTVIRKSIRRTDNFDDSGYFDTKIIENACCWVERGGFLRTLLVPRLADVLLKTKWYERKLFLEAAIAAEDMNAINQFERFSFPKDTDFVIIGENDRRCKIYEYLLQRMKLKGSSEIISDTKSIDMLTIDGTIEIAKRGQLLRG
jgi:2-dehydro-3-deoxygalactonokinase